MATLQSNEALFGALPTNVAVLEFPVIRAEVVPESADAVEPAADALPPAIVWEDRIAEAREQAVEQARGEWEARLHDSLETERSAVAMACTSFAKARERYFAEVESEVVTLSLAIAARILQRQVAMDPTLLAGVVRVALAKLSETESASLCVAPEHAEAWKKAMKSSGLRVESDAALREGELQLRMNGGVADLGIEAQLVEIERGFFDLLAKRPA